MDENDTVATALQRHFLHSSRSDKRVRAVNAKVSLPTRNMKTLFRFLVLYTVYTAVLHLGHTK